MSRCIPYALLAVPLFAAPAWSAAPPTAARDVRGADVRPVVQGNTAFACDLYAKLSAEKGNLILSPFSVSAALAMTSAGARGKTLEEFEKTLRLPPQKQLHPGMHRLTKQLRAADGVELNLANALWGQKGKKFLPAFRGLLRDDYDGGLAEADFARAPDQARQRINKWVQERTDGQITSLVPPGLLKADTRLVLANAIHFKGKWASPFKEDGTAVKPFHVGKDKTRNVWLMKQRGSFRYHDQKELQALELPYAGEQLSMLILLPRQPEDMQGVEKLLTPRSLAVLGRNMTRRRVEVFLPRFKMATDVRLAKHLRSMGMPLAFGDSADLSGMDGGKEKLALDEVVHKAFIDVHEKGTEAGASTGAFVGSRSIEFVPVFRADHPFVFIIRDNRSGTVLFMGRVADPAAAK